MRTRLLGLLKKSFFVSSRAERGICSSTPHNANQHKGVVSAASPRLFPIPYSLLLLLLAPVLLHAHGEIAGGGAMNLVKQVQTAKASYRVTMMYSPSQPVAGEPTNVEFTVVRLLEKPDPLLGSEIPVTETPHASLLQAYTDQVVEPEIHMHSEGEAGVFGIAEHPFPAGGPFLLRSLIPFTGSYRLHFVVHTQSGDEFPVDLPINVKPDGAVLFRVWINLALCGLILGLTGMQLRKARAAARPAGGGHFRLLRPALIGVGSLIVVTLAVNVFVLNQVLAMRRPAVAPPPSLAVTANADGTYTVPQEIRKDLGLVLTPAKKIPLDQAVTGFGAVEADPSLRADIYAPLWGRIEYPDKPLAVGDHVDRRQLLVRVILELSAVERAPMETKQKDIRAALDQATQRRDAAKIAYERAQKLAASSPAFEQDAKWAKELLDDAEDAYQQIAKQDKDYVGVIKFRDPRRTPVIAPIAGTITSIDFVPGQLNLNGEYRKLFTITDTSNVWVRARMYLSDVTELRDGQTAEVFPEGESDRSITGKVRWIGDTVNPADRTVPVIVAVPNKNRRLALGSFARVEFPQRRQAVAVPVQSVLDDGTTRQVYVARDNDRFVPLEIQVGLKQDGWWQVLSGVQEGDQVIAQGAGLLGSLRQEQNEQSAALHAD